MTLNGYHDWYLPSKDELNELYINQIVIGGFTHDAYWSSTEYNNTSAWAQAFYNGSHHINSKNQTIYVRAIRAF